VIVVEDIRIVVNFEPLVKSKNNKSRGKVQWRPILCNPINKNSNNLSVKAQTNQANSKNS
jgi:hypothetical protein